MGNVATNTPKWGEVAMRLQPFIRVRVNQEADTDDVLQEVLLRMVRGLPGLKDEERFVSWMYRITRTTLADYRRWGARFPQAANDDWNDIPAESVADPTESGPEIHEVVAQSLSLFITLLPSPYRETMTLVELEKRSHKEAAELLGISVSGVKSRVQRGRAQIRAMLHACCELELDGRGRIIACEPRPLSEIPNDCCGGDQ